MSEFTEEDAVMAFAKAWNRLEPQGFLALLTQSIGMWGETPSLIMAIPR
jgi:hypothetical protein